MVLDRDGESSRPVLSPTLSDVSQNALTYDFEIQTRLRDLNIGDHIDSVECIRLIDEARQRFFSYANLPGRPEGGGLFAGSPEGAGYLVVGQKAEYLSELHVDPFRSLLVRLWVSRIGTSSFEVSAELRVDGATSSDPAVRAIISAVMIDREQRGPRPIDPELRDLLGQYLAEPVPMRS